VTITAGLGVLVHDVMAATATARRG
jgi:hypothetical protein